MKILLWIIAISFAALQGFILFTTQPVGAEVIQTPPFKADSERLHARVKKLSEEFHPRGFKNVENLDKVAAWLTAELTQLKAKPTEQTWQVEGQTYRNVSALYGPEGSPWRIVVGAHYDTADGLPGADDNGSGVAAALELAQAFAVSAPPFAVELVFYSLEEPPFFRTDKMGSRHHADALKEKGIDVRAMLALETMGFYSDEEDSQHFPVDALKHLYSSRGNYIALVGQPKDASLVRTVKSAMKGANDLPVYSINATAAIPGIDWSDHLNYRRHNWPAIMVTDTAPNRNRNYHRATDTADTLDYVRLGKAVEGVYAALYAVGSK